MPYPSGPCFKSRFATTASSDQIAEMKNGNVNARTSEARRSGAYRTYRNPDRIDPSIRSAGSADLNSGTRFQFTSTQITPANEIAFSANTLPAPVCAVLNAATINPPSAGPTARARLLLAAFKLTVSGIIARGTSSGTIACHAGLFIADPTFSRNVNASSVHGETHPTNVSSARIPTEVSIHVCQKISSFRRSKISAIAPASTPRINTGRLAAVCISAISSGEVVSTVINQVPAVSCIHVPTDDTVLAIHLSRNSGIRSGANPLTAGAVSTSGPALGVSRGIAHPV